MKITSIFKTVLISIFLITISACGSYNASQNLNEGAWETFNEVWDKWVESKGDIADSTMWSKEVEDGVAIEDIIDAINSVGVTRNIKNVGELPLSEELKARGIDSETIYVMSFCNPETARKMINFSPAMGGFLPCRVTIVGKIDPKTGKEKLTLYSMNMDMAIKMGKKMPPELLKETMIVRDTLWEMLEKGSKGDF